MCRNQFLDKIKKYLEFFGSLRSYFEMLNIELNECKTKWIKNCSFLLGFKWQSQQTPFIAVEKHSRWAIVQAKIANNKITSTENRFIFVPESHKKKIVTSFRIGSKFTIDLTETIDCETYSLLDGFFRHSVILWSISSFQHLFLWSPANRETFEDLWEKTWSGNRNSRQI